MSRKLKLKIYACLKMIEELFIYLVQTCFPLETNQIGIIKYKNYRWVKCGKGREIRNGS